MEFWDNKTVLVTGGNGFLGSYVVKKLKERGCKNIVAPSSEKYDLTDKEECGQMFYEFLPDIVIHLAAVVGGIKANSEYPASFFYDNLVMGIQTMDLAYHFGVEKFVAIGTICAYPKFCPIPFKEKDIWDGYPEETNAPYGLAKKMLLVQSQAYRKQHNFNSIYLLPVNLYGIGDNFDPDTSHVIPALIKKFINAIQENPFHPKVTIWGTGKPTREFLYVEDAAEGIVLATEKYNKGEPVNIGSGFEVSIKDLAGFIAKLTGFYGDVTWDLSKPDGQPRRCLDVSRAQEEFGFNAKTELREGLEKTVRWYKSMRREQKC